MKLFFFPAIVVTTPTKTWAFASLPLQVYSNSKLESENVVVTWELNKNLEALLFCGGVVVA